MGPTLKVLIVDDDEGDRRQVKRALRNSGLSCESIEARDIDEAMAACESGSFDCAVIDYQLPGSDGLDGISALHSRYPLMAILMSTGQGDEMVVAEAMKRGACDYIPKAMLDGASMRRGLEGALNRWRSERQASQDQREELERSLRIVEAALGLIAGFVYSE